MAINQSFKSYRQNEIETMVGLNTPHGRISILFDTILKNLDKLIDKHPKTDFVSLGKCVNAITILAGSLNMKDGGEIARNLVELYDYSRRTITEYLESKDVRKLEEVRLIFSKLDENSGERIVVL